MKPRVALITHDLTGGLGTMTAFLHRVLLDSGRFAPEVILLATSASDTASLRLASPASWRDGAHTEEIAWRGLTVKHVGAWGSEIEFQRYAPRRELSHLLRSYDVLQFVVGSPPWGCVASRTRRPRVLWTATTTQADRASRDQRASTLKRLWNTLLRPATLRAEKRALEEAHSVLALSPYTFDSLREMLPERAISLAPCGVDTELFRPQDQGAKAPVVSGEHTLEGGYILCVARLSDERKNLSLLLRAYAALCAKRTMPHLVLVGELPSERSLALLRELGIEERVQMLGVKPPAELAPLYRGASVFALSSDEEGLAIVLLEAMASGLPVVCTACGGPESVVIEGQTGFLTPVGDVELFAHALEKLVADPALRERMGQAARVEAQAKYALDVAGQPFLDACDDLLARFPRRARPGGK